MKVILIADVKGQGKRGDMLTVSDGYAQNYLLKNKLAEVATADKLNTLKLKNDAEERQKQLVKTQAMEQATKLRGKIFNLSIKLGDNGKMFGSITAKEIADEMTKQGYAIDKKQLVVKDTIKAVGLYTITVKLHTDVATTCQVNVTGK